MPSTEVQILGKKYLIKGDQSEEHIRELERLVIQKVNDVCNKYPNIDPLRAMILASFTMAEEIHVLRKDQDDITSHIEEKAKILSSLFD